jgi:hypothetical protein|tara:strand:+ start:300 stop:695 length:396 start_codon:yes stop_codon:yes gene_type:complete
MADRAKNAKVIALGLQHLANRHPIQEYFMTKALITAIGAVMLIGCSSWVQLTNEGKSVMLLPESGVASCARVGGTRSNTLNKILFTQRNRLRLEEELATLARNEAGSMGGDAIVIESPINDGTQRFGVYRC